MRNRYLGKANVACDLSHALFVTGEPVAVHQDNGDTPIAVVEMVLEAGAGGVFVENAASGSWGTGAGL